MIELNADMPPPRDFTVRVAECLTRWTGQPWKVTLSKQPGAATLQEQEQAKKAQAIAGAASNPLVASVLEQFPGAKLTTVTST
jgi:DNA polymerase-3 subunit gamma/tau